MTQFRYSVSRPLLQGTRNTREPGGSPLAKGAKPGTRRFLRSDAINTLTRQDKARLQQMGLSLVVDLRSQMEQRQARDPQLSVPHVSFPLLDQVHSRDPFASSSFPRSMAEVYIGLLEGSQSTLRQLFACLAHTEGCVLFHCTAGKDRTGLTAMLLLKLAGVEDEPVIEDYAASGEYLNPHLSSQTALLRRMGIADPQAVLGSAPDNMTQTLRHLKQKYGSVQKYLHHIGVEPTAMEALRDSMIEKEENDGSVISDAAMDTAAADESQTGGASV